ncbi:unnamed protein product [Ambrosiozyma monospora]|uniref:Unnamed protein product n=1 Tax=Ambrosiozyma monospora TaxID=43982 RepID=A0A9W6YUZ2_AMBMO|nr:unnamed protein product [Ambrosiozyma monospora]
MAFSNSTSNSNLNLNLNETGIKLASCLPREIQHIILKFIIKDFLYFIHSTHGVYPRFVVYGFFSHIGGFFDHTTIKCSGDMQAEILSMTGYDDLLDDIICMALEELELRLPLGRFVERPFLDEFINFVSARSIQLKRVELLGFEPGLDKHFTNPNTMKLLESHSDRLSLECDTFFLESHADCLFLKFVSFLFVAAFCLPRLLDSHLLYKLTSLTKFSVELYRTGDLSSVERIMEHLQLAAPSVKHLYLKLAFGEESEESCVDFLVQANTFIRKHKNLYIQFDICFSWLPIGTKWRLDSKTQFSLPLHTTYPMNTKEVDRIEQWCSVSGITALHLFSDSIPLLTNTEMTTFTRTISSTVSTLVLKTFSAEYEIVLDGFRSLKSLEIINSILNKFPSLPESLQELSIRYVNDLTMSDMDHGITLPTRLCTLEWNGNLSCFTLPKILNIDKLLDLKNVSVGICPFQFNDSYGEEYDLNNYVTRNFLRVSNACTIDQLQQFVSQLPSDLEILLLNIYGFIRPDLDNYSACCPDQVSFQRFTKLGYLQFNCFSDSNSFSVSDLPGIDHLTLLSPPVLSGCFAQGIRSLDVDLALYEESLSYFLSHFISKLTRLVCLSISIDHESSADIRDIALSSQLCSFSISFYRQNCWRFNHVNPNRIENRYGCILLDTLPVQLKSLSLYLSLHGHHDIIVDDCKGESISSIAKRVLLSDYGEANWFQYSHFDCDEESFGIESLYAS